MSVAGEWVVYTRPGCTLCEEFLAQLAELIETGPTAIPVQVVDIDGDAVLSRRYSDRVPVLTIDGDFVCAYRLDRERLRPYLSEPQNAPRN